LAVAAKNRHRSTISAGKSDAESPNRYANTSFEITRINREWAHELTHSRNIPQLRFALEQICDFVGKLTF
jgi:hypothetical protein